MLSSYLNFCTLHHLQYSTLFNISSLPHSSTFSVFLIFIYIMRCCLLLVSCMSSTIHDKFVSQFNHLQLLTFISRVYLPHPQPSHVFYSNSPHSIQYGYGFPWITHNHLNNICMVFFGLLVRITTYLGFPWLYHNHCKKMNRDLKK